jgi:hypothetical protein
VGGSRSCAPQCTGDAVSSRFGRSFLEIWPRARDADSRGDAQYGTCAPQTHEEPRNMAHVHPRLTRSRAIWHMCTPDSRRAAQYKAHCHTHVHQASFCILSYHPHTSAMRCKQRYTSWCTHLSRLKASPHITENKGVPFDVRAGDRNDFSRTPRSPSQAPQSSHASPERSSSSSSSSCPD